MKEIQNRWQKKKKSIESIADGIQSLRNQVTRDLTNEDEKTSLTALVIAIIDKTAERVGNEESKENGHIGITGLDKNNVRIFGNTISLKYIGKSGVEQEKKFSSDNIAKCLKKAISNFKSSSVFETSDGFKIKSDRVNRYLSEFDITAKDLRGYAANKWVIDKLSDIEHIEETESKRQRQFNDVVSFVSEKIGHGKSTLKNHYLFPSIEYDFVIKSEISEIKDLSMKKIGGNLSKTPAPKKDRIYGSKVNKEGSASSKESAKQIKLANEIIDALEIKLREFKKEHKKSSINLNSLKAVYRRGLGAYSSTHRPTISGGKPNTRNAWAMARVNKFLEKASGKKVKASYVQDDDLMRNGGYIESNSFEIKLYSVIISDETDSKEVYFGNDYEYAKSKYDSLNEYDAEGFYQASKVILEHTFIYEFVGVLNDDENINDYPIDFYWDDTNYYIKIDEKETKELFGDSILSKSELNEIKRKDIKQDINYLIEGYVSKISGKSKTAGMMGGTKYFLMPYLDGNILIRIADHDFNLSNVNLGYDVYWLMYNFNPDMNEKENILGFLSISILDYEYLDRKNFYRNYIETRNQSKYPNLVKSIRYNLPEINDVEDIDFKDDIDDAIIQIKNEIRNAKITDWYNSGEYYKLGGNTYWNYQIGGL